MPQINLVWNDSANQIQTYQLSLSATELSKRVMLGRDQQRCQLWLAHNTVSRVHAELSFKPDWQRFYLQNLALNNPARVDGGLITQGEAALYQGSVIQLGQILLQVSEVIVDDSTPHTHPPHERPQAAPSTTHSQQADWTATAPNSNQPISPANAQNQEVQATPMQSVAPKLICPKCQTPQQLSLRNSNCPVCGHFLADAASRYFF
ncbi:MAG: FHA domain-containing protein [Cyanobacteria bacterium J06632_3]